MTGRAKAGEHAMSGVDVSATCWCERKVVTVSPDEVWAGLTASCGRPDCNPPTGESAMGRGVRDDQEKRTAALRAEGGRSDPPSRSVQPSQEPGGESGFPADPSLTPKVERLMLALSRVLGTTSKAPAETRCMGRRCLRRAEVLVSTVDENMAPHTHPVRLCRFCLTALNALTGQPVDIFRWLSDCRIEADA